MIALIATEVIFMSRASFSGNVIAAILGCVVGVVVLGFGRANNLSRFMSSGGRYVEWSPIGADRLLTWTSAAAWVVGIVNIFYVAWELSR